jgi:acetyl-CoA carboxylase carboxyltransferase component
MDLTLDLRTCEEWISFLDEHQTFTPLVPAPAGSRERGDEIITGFCDIAGKTVALFAHNTEVDRGYVSAKGALKIQRLQERCLELGLPLVGLLSSPGVSIREGLVSGNEYAGVLMGHCRLSGVVPQFACLMGANIGGAAYSATLMDFILFQKARSYMCVSGPGVVAQALGETTTYAHLGGAGMHNEKTGQAHFVDASTESQLRRLKWLIRFFPSNFREDPGRRESAEPIAALPEIPEAPEVAFDMLTLIAGLTDQSNWVEYAAGFGPSMITAWSYIGGQPVGIVANQSLFYSGAITAESSQKAARFVRLCDAYNIPVLTLIDTPGFMPGVREEQAGLLRQGGLLCQAMLTKVPKISVTVRKCYGAAAIVLTQTQNWRGDLALALPTARTAVMGFESASHLVYADEIRDLKSDDPATADLLQALKNRYRQEYERPEVAQQHGLVDHVIPLDRLRSTLIRHLEIQSRKRAPDGDPVRGIFT